ncbi:MAG TPA: YraN family protein [Caldisericia bacterium]|nr:YraN family protein [Caldisericia bacterium]HPF48536.1 YraN family protein [Caldisericia bacterium]HPI84594.1 YraN family protein [Caldisericia bacterium]HPQ92991.1 YraN family protein [Caldisericia bacterium]HRV75175.1 YraN family protein [Caldisericia bacterium]
MNSSRRSKTSNTHKGRLGEDISCKHLQSRGFVVQERNHKTREGEIDVIASNDSLILFVEVKRRTSKTFGLPIESLPKRRIERLFNASLLYLEQNPQFQKLERGYLLHAIYGEKLTEIEITS